MYPGRITRITESKLIAADVIHPRTDVVYVQGATQIRNITPTFGARSGQLLFIIAVGGSVTLKGADGNGGNIYGGYLIPNDRAVALLWSRLGTGANGWVVLTDSPGV